MGVGSAVLPDFSGCFAACSSPTRALSHHHFCTCLIPTGVVLLPSLRPAPIPGLGILSAPNPHPLSCLLSSLPNPASGSIPWNGDNRAQEGGPGDSWKVNG